MLLACERSVCKQRAFHACRCVGFICAVVAVLFLLVAFAFNYPVSRVLRPLS